MYRVLADDWFSLTTRPAELLSFYPGADTQVKDGGISPITSRAMSGMIIIPLVLLVRITTPRLDAADPVM